MSRPHLVKIALSIYYFVLVVLTSFSFVRNHLLSLFSFWIFSRHLLSLWTWLGKPAAQVQPSAFCCCFCFQRILANDIQIKLVRSSRYASLVSVDCTKVEIFNYSASQQTVSWIQGPGFRVQSSAILRSHPRGNWRWWGGRFTMGGWPPKLIGVQSGINTSL